MRSLQTATGAVAEMRFIRAAKIARNLDLKLSTARRLVKAGLYGVPRFMNGEWVAPLTGYEAYVTGATVAPVVKAEQLAGLRRGAHEVGQRQAA